MNRRLFLSSIAAAVGSTFLASRIFSQGMHHDMGGMGGMNHGAMSGGMGGMGGMMQGSNAALLPVDVLVKGQPLQTLPIIKNTSKEAGVFVATLMAMPTSVELVKGVKTNLWLYNGMIAPMIEVNDGDKVDIALQNHLPQATTVHWHGAPVPPSQDGNPQDAVASGSSRNYQFTLPKNSAATYWFHPHPHGDTPEQVYRGLAGVFIVRSKNDPLRDIPEQNLVISDLKLDTNGQIAPNNMQDWMNGREGQFVLVNGQREPVISLNGTQRWRIWNANSGRYLKLSLAGLNWQLVGTDGGLLEAPQSMDELLLSPGERAEIIVHGDKEGSFKLMALAYERGKMGMVPAETDRVLATIKASKGKTIRLPEKLRSLPDFGPAKAKKRLEYTETMNMSNGQHGMDFLINGKSYDMSRVDLRSKLGEVEEWEIFNNSHMDHSFHLHGTQFMVIETELNGVKQTPKFRALKDTINLRPYETARIKTVQNHKGFRMYHCHILEHEGLGMMGQLEVI